MNLIVVNWRASSRILLASTLLILPACVSVTRPAAEARQPVSAAARAASEFIRHQIKFNQFCFTGPVFPACEFEDPAAVQGLIGPYAITARYFDSAGREVATAEKPGRYAAVVEINRKSGAISRRFATLCRLGGDTAPQDAATLLSKPELLKKAGIDEQVLTACAEELAAPPTGPAATPAQKEHARTIRVAGLMDLSSLKSSGRQLPKESLLSIDWQWWVNFKRRYYGFDKKYPGAFVAPRPMAGEDARIIHGGTLAEAGMKPNAVKTIDAASADWFNQTGMGFSLCVVRHGVIVVNKGYGLYTDAAGKERLFSADTSAPLASTTMFLGGLLLLEFVDQELIDLDDPVDKYLPAFQGITVRKPATVRDLYLHVSGFTNALSDIQQDAVEIAADLYPSIEVRGGHCYTTAGLTLGGKMMEMISGKPVPRLFRQHLLAPLELTDIDVQRTAGGGNATALGLARIGQMALNGGAYGSFRFFSPATLAKAMPVPEKDRWDPPDKSCRWGVGIKQFDGDGLSDKAYGHLGASGTCLAVDPAYDLVIAMVRFREGDRFKDFLVKKAALYKAILTTIDSGK